MKNLKHTMTIIAMAIFMLGSSSMNAQSVELNIPKQFKSPLNYNSKTKKDFATYTVYSKKFNGQIKIISDLSGKLVKVFVPKGSEGYYSKLFHFANGKYPPSCDDCWKAPTMLGILVCIIGCDETL